MAEIDYKALAQQYSPEQDDDDDVLEGIINDDAADQAGLDDDGGEEPVPAVETPAASVTTPAATATGTTASEPVASPTGTTDAAAKTGTTPTPSVQPSGAVKGISVGGYTKTPGVYKAPDISTETEKKAYEQAVADRDRTEQENITSLRDLLDKYKPETPEEKARRERQERTRQNIVGFSNMAAALGNLATAASSSDGRAVKVEPSSDDLDKAIQRERKDIRDNDAKGIQLRNQYIALRKKMADDRVASTWQAYKMAESQKQLANKNAIEIAKATAQEQREWAKLQFSMDKEANQQAYRKGLLAVKNAALKSKGAGDKKTWISLPMLNGQSSCLINPKALEDPIVQGALMSLLPNDYFKTEGSDALMSAGKSQTTQAMTASMLMNYIGKYLVDGGIELPEGASLSDITNEEDRWNRVIEVLKSIGGEFRETAKGNMPGEDEMSGKSTMY